jgi:hypothetical protein
VVSKARQRGEHLPDRVANGVRHIEAARRAAEALDGAIEMLRERRPLRFFNGLFVRGLRRAQRRVQTDGSTPVLVDLPDVGFAEFDAKRP